MKILIGILFILFMSANSFAGFEGLQDGASLKIFNRINCSTGMTCTRGANGLFTVTSDPSSGSVVEADVAAQAEGLNVGRLAIFDYDFAVDGGSIGTSTTGVSLPANAVIEKCWFRVESQVVGDGDFGAECEDSDNILTPLNISVTSTGSFLASQVTGTSTNMVDDIAATCDISYTITGTALTAGKLRGWCRYSVHE